MKFTDRREKGWAWNFDYKEGHDVRQQAMDIAIVHARHTLPLGTVFEVRTLPIPEKTSPRQRWGVAWYTSLEIPQLPLFEGDIDADDRYVPELGCRVVARLVA